MVIGPQSQISSKLISLIVVAVAALCYVNILPNDFCYDDVPVVQNNQKIQGDDQWEAIWTTDYWSQTQSESPHRDLLYRPVALSLFRLTRLIAGPGPLAFHAISIALHALCTVLVVQLVLFLRGSTLAALLAGLIFAVLPIHSEAIASVVGQTDLLATAGTIGAVLCHFRVIRSQDWAGKAAWIVAAMACAFVAMGAKESGICVVPIIVLAEWLNLPLQAASGDLAERERTLGPALGLRMVRTTYLLIPLAAYMALRYYALDGTFHQAPAPTKTVNVLVDAPPWQRVLGVLQAWGMYWSKTIFPRELVIEYAINAVRLPTSLIQAQVLMGAAWAMGLTCVAVWGWRRGQKHLVFFVAALLLAYLPTSNAFILIQVFFAERIWYLPSVFVAALGAMAMLPLLDRKRWRGIGAAILVVLVFRCWIRNAEWKNNGTLFAATYVDHPQSVQARHLYGQWLTQHGDVDRGIEILEGALRIDLGFTDAHRALGHALLKAGRFQEAVTHLQVAEMQVPGHLQTQGELKEAVEALQEQSGERSAQLRQAADAKPGDIEAQLNYARFLRSVGKTSEALEFLESGQERFGSSPLWLGETATTLVYLNRRDEAIGNYERALDAAPQSDQLMVELSMLLLERRARGDIDRARELANKAVQTQPKSAAANAALGEIQAFDGDLEGARRSFREAIRNSEPQYTRILIERSNALGL